MTDERMALVELLQKSGDGDLRIVNPRYKSRPRCSRILPKLDSSVYEGGILVINWARYTRSAGGLHPLRRSSSSPPLPRRRFQDRATLSCRDGVEGA
jgi:hypothetical protein